MRIVVTGSGGFIGRHVVAYAEQAGHDVYRSLIDLEHRMHPVWPNADAVIHCAGFVGGIALNQERPADLMDANLRFLINALSVANHSNIRRFVNLGSVCSYPNIQLSDHSGMKPSFLWDGRPEESNAPYGIAKRAGMELVSSWRKQYGMIGNNLILANVYGPGVRGKPSSHVIPALVERFMAAVESGAETVTVWGTGEARREFLYVEDAARAIVDVGLAHDIAEPLNICGSPEVTIKALAELIAELTGFPGSIEWDATKPDSRTSRRLDGSALRAKGFAHRFDLETGLKNTIEWIANERRVKRIAATAGV